MAFLDMLRGDMPANSAVLRVAIGRTEAKAEAASARLLQLSQARAAALLDAGDLELDRIEAELASAQRQADRADLAIVELRRRLEQAEADERQAELDAIYEKGQAAARRGVELIRGAYRKHAVALAQIAREMVALHEAITGANIRLAAAGYPKSVPDFDRFARPWPADMKVGLGSFPVWEQLRLPSSEDPYRCLFPPVDVWGMRLNERDRPAR
jgi:hypothetical protein